MLVGEGPRYACELIEVRSLIGNRRASSSDSEAAHSVHRILHAGDFTGRGSRAQAI